MLAPELIKELELIAYCPMAKPQARVGALSSLARNNIDLPRVRDTLFKIATDANTPDVIKVRAIDLQDKLAIDKAPKQLSEDEANALAQDLMDKYVGKT